MKQALHLSVFLFSLISSGLFSQSSTRLDLGTPENILNDIKRQHTRTTSTYTLPLNTGASAVIDIEHYYEGTSGFSMNGTAKESASSLFLLKGDRTSLYGYLVLHESKKAFEITTANNRVSVEAVNIARIYPDLYEKEIVPPAQHTPRAAVPPVYSPMANRQVIHIGKYNNEDVTRLQSKPNSKYVFYLNHSAVMNGTVPKNGRSKEDMYRMWQCVADQYSMFDLNVTTDPEVYNAAKANDVLKTGNIKFVDADGRSNACVACFGTTAAGTLYRNPLNDDYGYGIGMTCAHEMGHQMGMSHDGGSAQADPEYFFGLPAVEWCPIMGNYWKGGSWQNQLFTWSKGEYNTATQKQDDLKIMNVNEKVPYRTDDIPVSKALTVSTAGVIAPGDNWGQIEKNTDSDAFTFKVGSDGGTINLKIDPIEYLRQLDVAAKIVNAEGTTVASSNLPKHRSAEFKNLALPGGTYSLIIQGGAELTPQTGFSNYSSLGYYAMEGTLTGAIATTTGTVTLENAIAVFPNPTSNLLNISCAYNSTDACITLSNVRGETVFSSAQFVKSIDMADLAKGIYFLKVTHQGATCVKKISKL